MKNHERTKAGRATITACHHTALCVHDIAEARHFYGEVLSLVELERPPEITKNFASAWYLLGSMELHVVEFASFEPLDSPLGPHIAVTTSDFDAMTQQIAARGGEFKFGPGPGFDGVSRAIIDDPTGNTVEITAAPLRA